MGGVGSLTNPIVLVLFVMLLFGFGDRIMIASFGALLMLGLWIQGDSWIIGLFRGQK